MRRFRRCWTMIPNTSPNEDDLSRLSLPELIDLMHRVADEILLREMQTAGETEDV